MSRSRIVRALLVTLLVSTGGCVPVHNLLADRELVCEGTPDDLCLRVADLGSGPRPGLDIDNREGIIGPTPKLSVIALPQERCWRPNLPDARRCWSVEAELDGGGSVDVGVVERGDGSLVID